MEKIKQIQKSLVKLSRDWKAKIDIADIFKEFENLDDSDRKGFKNAKNKIIVRLKEYIPKIRNLVGENASNGLEGLIVDLNKSINLRNFNHYWNELYDWADDYSVWIATF